SWTEPSRHRRRAGGETAPCAGGRAGDPRRDEPPLGHARDDPADDRLPPEPALGQPPMIQRGRGALRAKEGVAPGRQWEILLAALRLGLTSFGGPIAHLGCFREEYVQRRRWLDDQAYAGIVALCQFLPGPASSQV